MIVSRPLRFAVLVVIVLMAVPAAAVKAQPRMPVGFFDDPSFRWSIAAPTNLRAASAAHTSIVHVLADWSQIAPDKPTNPLNGDDPAYNLSRPRHARQHGAEVRAPGPDHDHGRAEVGERRPDDQPSAEAPLRPDELRPHARRALQRPSSRVRRGDALVGVERAESRALPHAAVQLERQDRQPAGVREALDGGIHRDQGRQPAARRSPPARRRTAATTTRPAASPASTRSRRRRSRISLRRQLRTCRSSRGPSIRTRRSRIRRRRRRRRIPKFG